MKHRENPPRPPPPRPFAGSEPPCQGPKIGNVSSGFCFPSVFTEDMGGPPSTPTRFGKSALQEPPFVGSKPGQSYFVTPPKFNIDPEEWCLEGYFPIEGSFSGAILREGTRKFHNSYLYVWDLQPRSPHRLVEVPSGLDLFHVLAQALSIFSSNAIGNHTVITMGLLGCRVGQIVAMLSMVFVSLLVTAATTSATSCDTVQLLQQAMVHQELNLYERPPANRSHSKMKLVVFVCEVDGANKVQGLFWLGFLEEVVFCGSRQSLRWKMLMRMLWNGCDISTCPNPT